jgi:hypothetical protein
VISRLGHDHEAGDVRKAQADCLATLFPADTLAGEIRPLEKEAGEVVDTLLAVLLTKIPSFGAFRRHLRMKAGIKAEAAAFDAAENRVG